MFAEMISGLTGRIVQGGFIASMFTLALVSGVVLPTQPANAACAPPGPYGGGADHVVCAPGAGESFNTLNGNDTVQLDAGTLGTILMGRDRDTFTLNNGSVVTVDQDRGQDTFILNNGTIGTILQGSSSDQLTISGGAVTVLIDQGSFGDTLTITAGTLATIDQGSGADTMTISGATAGDVDQGSGVDNFTMGPGTVIASLDQSSNLDIAIFNGGHIVGLFDNGDTAYFHAGRIGAVDLASADNLFQMDGTFGTVTIDTFLSAEQGDDRFLLTAGTIGTFVNTGSHDDFVLVDGTDIGGNIETEVGNDEVQLLSGTITGSVLTDRADRAIPNGDDDIVLLDGAIIGGNIETGRGVDTITLLSGTLAGDVLSGVEGDTVLLDGADIGGDINTDTGADDIKLLSGTVTGDVLAGADNDTVLLNGADIGGDINTDTGADDIKLTSGTVTGDVLSGADNDTVLLNGAAITGAVETGTGNDSFVWSAGTLSRFTGGDGTDIALVSASEYNGSQVLDGGDDVTTGDGWRDVLTLSGVSASTSGTNLVNWEVLNLDNANIEILDGALTVGSETGNGLFLTNNSILNGANALTLTGNLNIDGSSRFDATGNGAGLYVVTGNLVNAGRVEMGDGVAGDTLTINGDYSGTGAITLDTVLGDSASQTDKVTINGDPSGTTTLDITNAGGTGAETGAGPGDGILVVQVDGTSNAIFTLVNPLSAGAFNYALVKADNQNWYLQSALMTQVYGYSALAAVLAEDVDTLWQRIGLGRELVNRDGTVSNTGSGFWMRASWSNIAATSSTMSATSSADTNLSTSLALTQIGYEQRLYEAANGYLSAGIFAHYKRFGLDVFDSANEPLSHASADGYGGGLSLTWNSRKGFYGDLIGQITAFGVGVKDAGGVSAAFNALTYSASAEVGYRFEIDDAARLVPQAQLIWRGSRFDGFSDSSGVVVNWTNGNRFTARAGLALEVGNTIANGGSGFTGYAIANLLHDFGTGTILNASGTNITTSLAATRFEIRFGTNLASADNKLNFFAEAGFSRSLDAQAYHRFKGVLGLKVNF